MGNSFLEITTETDQLVVYAFRLSDETIWFNAISIAIQNLKIETSEDFSTASNKRIRNI
jgi:hypothetical protein